MENPLKSGISVLIPRTDGRTHPAVITQVNMGTRLVSVEWYEDGETKGKDVDFDAVVSLNINLVEPTESSSDLQNNVNEVEPSFNPLARDATRSNISGKITTRYSTQISNGNYDGGRSKKEIDQMRRTLGPIVEKSSSDQYISNRSKLKESMPPPPAPAKPHRNIPTAAASRASVVVAPREPEPAPLANAASNQKSGKRSNVVKEVEKLRKNREERRQRQAEKKEEKEALMSIDPGNPNWHFLAMIREHQSNLEFHPLRETDPVECHQINVCVRKRPLNKKELSRKEIDVITVSKKDTVIVHEPKHKVDLTKYLENQSFRFDYSFDDTCSNELVYRYTAQPLVQTIFQGGMATCFAYGQTGSGKTHTMGGIFSGKNQDCKKGIYAMVAKDVYKLLNSPQYRQLRLIITCSFFEIYSGKVFDLLADKAKLRVLEDGKQQVQVVGLTEKVVGTVEEVLALITAGNQARTSGQTSVNSNSSRSHAVFQITLRTPDSHQIYGKFSLIDLAGNERGADTSSADRLTRMEGAEINKSLLALKECIRALGRKGAHLPFRASKLTQVLRDSFIGDNSKICMIAMISPGLNSCENTLNTLRYADRVKELAPDTGSGPPTDTEISDDLAALRSLNANELSADLFHLHEAIDQLQQKEEELLESFKGWIETTGAMDRRQKQLLNMTKHVDYDQEAFATGLKELLDDRERWTRQIRDQVQGFLRQLTAEEEMSKTLASPAPSSRYN